MWSEKPLLALTLVGDRPLTSSIEKVLHSALTLVVQEEENGAQSVVTPGSLSQMVTEHGTRLVSKAWARVLGSELGVNQVAAEAAFWPAHSLPLHVWEWPSPPPIINRYCTILPYLSNVEEGGETVFPLAELSAESSSQNVIRTGMPECSQGLVVKPHQGDAAFFYHRQPNGNLDFKSEHGGCPPVRGVKYAINGFMWNVPWIQGLSFMGM